MTIQNYEVFYSVSEDGPWYELSDVQNIDITIGRQDQLDQVKASTGSISARYPTGYALPNTFLVSGNFIKVENATGSYIVWLGIISNVTVSYGIPYANSVGQADRIDISVEGAFARLGRLQGDSYAMAAGTVAIQAANATTEITTVIAYNNPSSTETMSATTVTGTWADWLSQIALSLNARIIDGTFATDVWIRDSSGWNPTDYPTGVDVSTINFSDTTNNATNQVYDVINFQSVTDNYYTQVIVSAAGFADAIALKAGAVQPYRTYQVNTLNGSLAQAQTYADYLLSIYGNQNFELSSVSCLAEAQNNFKLDTIGGVPVFGSVFQFPFSIGTEITVTFRGTVYNCIIEGCTMSATYSGARFTYYLSQVITTTPTAYDSPIQYNEAGYIYDN
jgi:hypothetical protein